MITCNTAIIAGNLTRDIELRYTTTQKAFASFSVAVNRRWKDAKGELREEAYFIPVVVWGKTAENCAKYLKKGDNVLVEGYISTRTYEGKGEKRFVVEVQADSVQFLSRVNSSAGSHYSNGYEKVTVTEGKKYDAPSAQKSNFSDTFPSDSSFDTKSMNLGDDSYIPF